MDDASLTVEARRGTFCDRCGEYAIRRTDLHDGEGTFTCAHCGRSVTARVAPLLILTGASGAGKTSVIAWLQRELREFGVYDKDAMWASDWDMAYNNLFRIASANAQGGRPTMIVGTLLPEMIDHLSDRGFVDPVRYANLHCDDATRRARLLGRRTWGIPDEDFIRKHEEFAAWLLANADTAFGAPMPTFDTSATPVEEVGRQVAAWARSSITET